MPTPQEIADAVIAGLSAEDALAGVKPSPTNTAPKTFEELTTLVSESAKFAERHSQVIAGIDKALKLAEAEAVKIADAMTTLSPTQRETQRNALFAKKRKEIIANQDKQDSDNWKSLRALTDLEKRAEATAKYYPSPSAMVTATLWNDPEGAGRHLAILKSADVPTLKLARLHVLASPTAKRLMGAALHSVIAAMPLERQRLLGFTAQEFAAELAGEDHKRIVADVQRIKFAARDALNRWRNLQPTLTASTKARDKIVAGLQNRHAMRSPNPQT